MFDLSDFKESFQYMNVLANQATRDIEEFFQTMTFSAILELVIVGRDLCSLIFQENLFINTILANQATGTSNF